MVSIDIGTVVRLEISKIVHGGLGLARHDGQVIFCPGVVPGDVVSARVREVKKSHGFADLVDVLSPGPDRQPHIWREADWRRPPEGRPGSADFGHITIDAQRRIKSEILREALIRQGRFSESDVSTVVIDAIPGRPDGLHWRTRETLHVSGSVAGPRAASSHTVVPVTQLPLAHQAINDAGAHTTNWEGHSSVRLVWSANDGVITHVDRDQAVGISETVHGHTFFLDSRSFWQVHTDAPEVLWSAVTESIVWDEVDQGAPHLDLYGGVGLFARAFLSQTGDGASIVSVESDPVASGFAGRNIADYSGSTAHRADAVAFLRDEASVVAAAHRDKYRGSVVIVDPPRSGLGTSAVAALIGLRASQVIYVACDPVAFARDAAHLREAGYHLTSLKGFDLFPHTHHMEVVAGFGLVS